MCARCSFECPTDAFRIGILNGWRVNGAYPLEGGASEEDPGVKNKHEWYCRRAYARYFAAAKEKIEKDRVKRLDQESFSANLS